MAVEKSFQLQTEVICADHTLHLIVTKRIANMKLIKKSVNKCGELVTHLHRSTLSCIKLKKICADLNIYYKKVILPYKTR